ncbi:MAG: glycine cleavage system protein GcvH [Deltaproteobacteria bacterium]|nr:glycine cleavage system protein GcvH [Deltaproteobacteria bacterium]
MEFPRDRLYSEHHLWVKVEDSRAAIGITDYAREEFGAVDYVELPSADEKIVKNRQFGAVETSKAVTDLIAPISGVVIESNVALIESPALVSDAPYGEGWLLLVTIPGAEELKQLLNSADYEGLLKSQSEE